MEIFDVLLDGSVSELQQKIRISNIYKRKKIDELIEALKNLIVKYQAELTFN